MTNASRERQDERARVLQTVIKTGKALQLVDQLLDMHHITLQSGLGQAVQVLQLRRSLEQELACI